MSSVLFSHSCSIIIASLIFILFCTFKSLKYQSCVPNKVELFERHKFQAKFYYKLKYLLLLTLIH
jgi:hypothetical protein